MDIEFKQTVKIFGVLFLVFVFGVLIGVSLVNIGYVPVGESKVSFGADTQVKEAEKVVQEIDTKLKEINKNFNKIYEKMLKAKIYNVELVRRVKSGGTYLQKRLNKLPYRLLAAVFKRETIKTISNWQASVRNVIELSEDWHKLFSGNDPDFKNRKVTLKAAQQWAETWYNKKKKETKEYEKTAKTFELSQTFGKSSKTLQNIFKLMHTRGGMLDGVYYTVGAPLGLNHTVYLGLTAWPKFRLRK